MPLYDPKYGVKAHCCVNGGVVRRMLEGSGALVDEVLGGDRRGQQL
jgi:hypothetical protein